MGNTENAPLQHTHVSGEGSEYADVPGRHITPNMVVAYNMARWRRAAGLTQEELADRLNRGLGEQVWSNASVSAAERSWDGRRVRQFDADTIASLATALGLPVSALFLPPADDGVEQRYLMDLPDVTGQTRCVGMRDLLELATHAGGFDWEGDDAALQQARTVTDRYRQALDAALSAYRIEGEVTYAEDAWGARGETDPHVLEEKLARTRAHYEALRQLLGDIARVQDALYAQLGDTGEAEAGR
ncbi:helix-turn-helix domain-containing protein [Sphaerimonospora mesophila]|uniref:helix-turn-helix domain-containing protein n=1 Tax=Sphaerimonospora mesophila TaxID=37483 RepID=UPI00128F66D9